jgi:hypothetical protein
VVVALLLASNDARAFSYGSALSSPCHEQITSAALRRVRLESRGAALPANRNERALIADLPFDVDPDMQDLGAATLLVGVRDNDLKGRGPNEVDQLATIHGDPAFQREHCLRGPTQDEPGGSEAALADCRTFIKDKVLAALEGLDASGAVDPGVRTDIDVALSLRGGVTAPLPRFYVRMGQAIHALQDSFTHTFRTSDGMRVRVVLNWIDLVNGNELESRDGPVHRAELDRCDDPDPLRTRNKALATDASAELLRAALDPRLDRGAKERAIDDVLSKYLAYEPGCGADTQWCDAPENKYPEPSSCGCSVVGNGPPSYALLGAAGLLCLTVALRRRKRRSHVRLASAVVLAGILASSSAARAEEEAPRAPATQAEAKVVDKEAVHSSPFALFAAGAGSFADPALAAALGGRFRLNDTWVVGLDGELNWWYGVHTKRLQLGATNIYGTLIMRFPMRFESVNLRSSLQLGTSIELLDLYGVPKGSVGLFAGLNPLGVEWKLTGHVYVIFYPLGVAVPVPHLSGAPFAYPQFRTTIGLELSL